MPTIDTPKILIVDPDETSQQLYRDLLMEHGAEVSTTGSSAEALAALAESTFDLLLAEMQMPGEGHLDLLQQAKHVDDDLEVILMTAFGSIEDVVDAMQNGACDFLTKPFTPEQLNLAVDKATRTHQLVVENHDLKRALDDRLKLDNMVASDPQMQKVLKVVQAVAPARTTVLITGESGTGKTLLARAIHKNSPRKDGPFVEVNCGALPENLLESELFGHERGAFTGAVKSRPGKFESADGGTIFLDEIGTSSHGFQVKLLRVLQDRVIERVGDSKPISVDVRIVLATNVDLAQAVADGTFREDLYYRIQVVALEMPPLRERRSDIAMLGNHFLHRFARDMGKNIQGFSDAALKRLVEAPWPGNVRQLENVIERAVVLTEHERIQEEDLPPGLASTVVPAVAAADPAAGVDSPLVTPGMPITLKEGLLGPEKELIQRALAHHKGNRKLTAETLDINRSTLFNKMRKFDLLD